MSTRPVLEPDLVLVQWTDAHADRSGTWVRFDGIEDEPLIVSTVGVLLPKTVKRGHLSIAQSYFDEFYDHVLHIPKKMVISIDRLSLAAL